MSAHGTRGRYGAGCRCEPCRVANREYMRVWMRGRYRQYAERERHYKHRQLTQLRGTRGRPRLYDCALCRAEREA